jgi:biotin carboxyl carrier protein
LEGKPEGGSPLVASTYTVTIGRSIFRIVPGSDYQVEANGTHHSVDFASLDGHSFSLILDGKTFIVERIEFEARGGNASNGDQEPGHAVHLSVNGAPFVARVDDAHSLLVRSFSTKPLSSSGILTVRAPMPGLISRIEVEVGEEVSSGKGLLVLEAMKMENEIRTPRHGRVQSILVSKGKPVEKGESLITIVEL